MKFGDSTPAKVWPAVVEACDEKGYFFVRALSDDAPEDARPAKMRRCDFSRIPRPGDRCVLYRSVDDNGGSYYARVISAPKRKLKKRTSESQ